MENNLNFEKDFNNKLGLTEKDYIANLPNINNEENEFNNRCISADVPRTTNNPDISKNLEEILKVFSITNEGLQYKSGMSFIVKTILEITNNNKIKTYIILRNIFENQDLHSFYDNDKYQNVMNKFELKFKEKMPILYQHFKKYDVTPIHYALSLLKTLFCFQFNENIAKDLLKIFIVKNDFDIYLNACLSYLKINEEGLLGKNFIGEILCLLNNNKMMINVNKFNEIMTKLK